MYRIPEADWVIFKELHPLALERFSQRIAGELLATLSDPAKSAYDRCDAARVLSGSRWLELEEIFSDFRRSNAPLQIAMMKSRGLLTGPELERFSIETRAYLGQSLGSLRVSPPRMERAVGKSVQPIEELTPANNDS